MDSFFLIDSSNIGKLLIFLHSFVPIYLAEFFYLVVFNLEPTSESPRRILKNADCGARVRFSRFGRDPRIYISNKILRLWCCCLSGDLTWRTTAVHLFFFNEFSGSLQVLWFFIFYFFGLKSLFCLYFEKIALFCFSKDILTVFFPLPL